MTQVRDAAADASNDLHDESPAVVAQCHELLADEVIARSTGGVIPNSFSLVLVRADDDPEHYSTLIRAATRPLNDADELLLGLCERHVAESDSVRGIVPAAAAAVRGWRAAIDANANLLGSMHAFRLFDLLPDRGAELLDRHPEVVEAFLDVHAVLCEMVRVNVFVPPASVRAVLRALLIAAEDSGAGDAIDRIEVAKQLEVWPAGAVPPFPTIMLYGGLRAGRQAQLASLARLLSLVGTVVAGPGFLPAPPDALVDFALPLSDNVYVTQGYRLYKKYLELLGAIGRRYDATTNHALVLPDAAIDAPFTAGVRHMLLRRQDDQPSARLDDALAPVRR